jgi:signal transduction histidine kinase
VNLLSRISLSYIIVSLLVLITGGCFFFYVFKKEVYEEIDEQMRDEKRNIERLIESSDTIPSFFSGVNTEIILMPVPTALSVKLERKDTIINHLHEGEITFRQWRYTVETGENNYLVIIRKSLIDLSDLSEQIFFALITGFIILLIGAAVVNYIILKVALRPFHQTLKQLKKYSLNRPGNLALAETSTREFKELNKTLELMTKQIENDFQRTKQFTENASHEIQTPLAIIRNKLELLMQSDKIQHDEASLIQSAYEAVNRLSRLNKFLILLTRIENNEFPEKKVINFGTLVKQFSSQMEEKMQLKGIKISIQTHADFTHSINETLAEILISNLLSNAIRYTERGNEIHIEIYKKKISFSNPGFPFNVHPEKLFLRFFKISTRSKSLGIGLSLAKTIAESCDLDLNYSHQNSTHIFSVEA